MNKQSIMTSVRKISAFFVLLSAFSFGTLLLSPLFTHAEMVGQDSMIDAPDTSFVALTSIPGIQEAADSGDIAGFLNTLYRLCIGAAAIIAVIQIIRGGIIYMMGDSFTEKKDAKHHITMAIIGLVLVLSPYLVFSVIDPRILNLSVDVGELKPPQGPDANVGGTGGAGGAGAATCTNADLKTALQASYNQMRQAQPNGTIVFQATGEGAGACCAAITTTGGSQACTFSGDRCSCTASTAGITGDTLESSYVPTRIFVGYNPTPTTEVRFYLDVNENRVPFTYPSETGCTDPTYKTSFDFLVSGIKTSTFFCATQQSTDTRKECVNYIPKIKSGDIEVTSTSLRTISQTCTEIRR